MIVVYTQLSLLLLPSVDDFEEQLLCNLAEDLVVEVSYGMVLVIFNWTGKTFNIKLEFHFISTDNSLP